jgi:hypothetical protein
MLSLNTSVTVTVVQTASWFWFLLFFLVGFALFPVRSYVVRCEISMIGSYQFDIDHIYGEVLST